MTLYCVIDLHANNSVLAVVDERGKLIFSKRYRNALSEILEELLIAQALVTSSLKAHVLLISGIPRGG